MEDLALVFVILVALGFDFVNGFHDAANSIATVVSTRVLSPRLAVLWAAAFNFIAFLFFGTHVASTIANDVVMQDVLTIGVIFAGLVGAIVWDLITFYLGLPTSSSHALVGGMAGAAVATAGFDVLVTEGIRKIGAVHRAVAADRAGRGPDPHGRSSRGCSTGSKRLDLLNKGFRRGQLVSAAAFSLGHGANDAQKTMGIILALLIAAGAPAADADVPLWVVLSRPHRHRPRHPHRRLAHREDDGLEDHPPPARPAGWRPSRPPPPRSSSRRPPASRCPPPTPSPAPSSGSAPPAACRRCGGASPAGWCGPGCSPSPGPSSSPFLAVARSCSALS